MLMSPPLDSRDSVTESSTLVDATLERKELLDAKACLNAKLTETHATERSIEARATAVRESIASGDTSRRNHEYTVLSVLGQNLNRLDQEANQCVGSDVYETGATRVETEIADNTPEEDISDIPDELTLPVPYIPPPASGTM